MSPNEGQHQPPPKNVVSEFEITFKLRIELPGIEMSDEDVKRYLYDFCPVQIPLGSCVLEKVVKKESPK